MSEIITGPNYSRSTNGSENILTNQLNTADNGATGQVIRQKYTQVGGSVLASSLGFLAAQVKVKAIGVSLNPLLDESVTVDITLDVIQGAANSASSTFRNTEGMSGSSIVLADLTSARAIVSATDSLGGPVEWIIITEYSLIKH